VRMKLNPLRGDVLLHKEMMACEPRPAVSRLAARVAATPGSLRALVELPAQLGVLLLQGEHPEREQE
jgi:hypothetical protein